jgi:proteasome lid subunit RPN8/RPN11
VVRDVEARYPREACGLVVEGADGARALCLRNVHASPHRGFAFDDAEHLRFVREVEAAGELVRGIYHSHPDGDARPSAEDVRWWIPGSQPLFPGVDLIVVSTRGTDAWEWARFSMTEGGALTRSDGGRCESDEAG